MRRRAIARARGGAPRRAPLALTLLCALVYLPGIAAIPPLDRDEARFAQASRQMLESGDFVGIRFQDQPRNKKPAGIHWLQAGSVALFAGGASGEIALYRLPSVVGAWLAVLFTFAAGTVLFDRISAFWGAAMLAGSVALVAEAHLATTDAVLLATVAAAQWVLAKAYARPPSAPRPGWPMFVLFWTALAAGVLVKGPIGPSVTLLTALALSLRSSGRWLLALRPLPGVALFAACVLPWFVAVSRGTDTGFVGRAIAEDLLPKLLAGQEGHGAPPGTHLVALAVLLWPASLFLLPALAAAWRARRHAGVRFCLAWLVPAWILFELVPTKLPHYVLPTYPALALLVGAALSGAVAARFDARPPRAAALAWIALTALLAVGLVLAGLRFGDGGRWWLLLTGALWLLAALLPGWLLLRRRRTQHAALAAIGAGALATSCLAGIYAPRLRDLWLAPAIAASVADLGVGVEQPVVAVDYHEPSLVFLLGTDTRLRDAASAAEHAAAHPGTVVVVASESEPAFLAALERLGARARRATTIEGFNYSKGRRLRLTLYVVGS